MTDVGQENVWYGPGVEKPGLRNSRVFPSNGDVRRPRLLARMRRLPNVEGGDVEGTWRARGRGTLHLPKRGQGVGLRSAWRGPGGEIWTGVRTHESC